MNSNKYSALLLVFSLLTIISCKKDPVDPPGSDLPTLNIADVILLESNDGFTYVFDVTLSEASTETVSVEYKTTDDTAVASEDYTSTQGNLTIAPGSVTAQIEVSVLGDLIREQDEEFKVELSNATNATIDDGVAIGRMRNDDTFLVKDEDGYNTPESYAGYSELWNDEFSGSEINTDIWTHEYGDSGWGNNELQNYTDNSENSFIEDDNLIIQAIKDGTKYSSARMITKDKKEFKYGRVDVRAKLPEGQGIWPAIWMLGANIDELSWPACGEIDIMEMVGHLPDQSHGTAHFGNVGEPSQYRGATKALPEGYQDKYHVFSIIWETSKVRWLIDEEQFHVIDANTTAGYGYPFNAPFFMIMNVAVGGNWPGNPDTTTQFPQRMTVDYVRVFQRN